MVSHIPLSPRRNPHGVDPRATLPLEGNENLYPASDAHMHHLRQNQEGLLPLKKAKATPWHTLCIDLIGPYTIGKEKEEITLHCLTMIDPATGWFKICKIPTKRADYIVNYLEFAWLT